MNDRKRMQFTLFIDETQSLIIEKVRNFFNPVQYELIKSHVTLCREDEFENTNEMIATLEKLDATSVSIELDKVIRFANGKGVMIPATENNESFYELRRKILSNKTEEEIRKTKPHITLMHPRNATCTNDIFEEIKRINFPKKILFNKISLIEQHNEDRWKTIKEINLCN